MLSERSFGNSGDEHESGASKVEIECHDRLVLRHLSDLVPCRSELGVLAIIAHDGPARARSPCRICVVVGIASTTAADVIDRGLVLHQLALAFELLVKAEDGALAVLVQVASSTTTGQVVVVGRSLPELDAGCWALSVCSRRCLLRVDVGVVAGSTSASVDVVR